MRNKAKLKNIDKNKLGLNNNAIYANFSLCPEYRRLWYNSKKLFMSKNIQAFWVTNGTVKVVVEEGESPHLIEHQSDLVNLFPTYNFAAPIVTQNAAQSSDESKKKNKTK